MVILHTYTYTHRCLDTLSTSHYDIEVHDAIVNRLNELLYETYCIDYIQSLMEHYPPGERVMKEMIPYGMYVVLYLTILSSSCYIHIYTCFYI